MDNIFYVPETDFNAGSSVEIKDQEAQHIGRVLRYQVGDIIFIADGVGNHFECEISSISKKAVSAIIIGKSSTQEPIVKKVLALGVIKKRDRLEFAIEKAVELGAWKIVLFNADHSERNRINKERVEAQIISAFKQSGRFWLPELIILDSTDEVYSHFENAEFLMAHVDTELQQEPPSLSDGLTVLMVGPEGGFSFREKELQLSKGGALVSLGVNRLRAETAVTVFLSQYLFSS
ncbi:MAG: RsmE family RNA methyltransferase [Balneola sp.]